MFQVKSKFLSHKYKTPLVPVLVRVVCAANGLKLIGLVVVEETYSMTELKMKIKRKTFQLSTSHTDALKGKLHTSHPTPSLKVHPPHAALEHVADCATGT